MKSKHTDWNTNISFIIHVDFGHAWAEHYLVTLSELVVFCNQVLDSVVTSSTKKVHRLAPTHEFSTRLYTVFIISDIRFIMDLRARREDNQTTVMVPN